MEHWAYIFVRQDISPEYQLVQFGHVCAVLGRNLPEHICPHKLNFVAIGVPNERYLDDIMFLMDRNGIKCHHFVEPDIGDQMTAVASEPISNSQRFPFKRYKTLKFGPSQI